MKRKAALFISLAAAVLFIAALIIFDVPESSETGFLMDTTVTVSVKGRGASPAAENAMKIISDLERRCISRTAEGSDISRVNASGRAEISAETEEILNSSLDICRKSGGALDIGLGALSGLWSVKTGNRPPEAALVTPLAGEKYTNIKCEGGFAEAGNGAVIDLGSVGKGAACDAVYKAFKNSKVKTAVLAVGGSIMLYGDRDFTIGIASPEKGSADYMAKLTLGECFVSTSGTYERYFDYGGVRYHHILDPKTGYPVQNGLVSVTVVADSGLLSDALSTACFVLGVEKGAELAKEYGCETVFITDSGEVLVSDGLKGKIELTDSRFTLS